MFIMKNSNSIFIFSYIGSLFFFVLGVCFPIFSTGWKIDILGWYSNEVYLLNSVVYFFEQRDFLLGFIIFIFTFLVPIVKYILYGLLIKNKFTPTPLTIILTAISKWSMLDVFILALTMFYIKKNSFWIEMKLHAGTYFFILSVMLLLVCNCILAVRKNRSSF